MPSTFVPTDYLNFATLPFRYDFYCFKVLLTSDFAQIISINLAIVLQRLQFNLFHLIS
jgi:hypothetical protein